VTCVEDGQDVLVGKIIQPLNICDEELDIQDANRNEIMKIVGPCCQLGLCFPMCPCEACQNVHFDIKIGDEVVGSLDKQTKGCTKQAFSDADNFALQFPAKVTDPRHRALLLAATLFLDYMYFEEK